MYIAFLIAIRTDTTVKKVHLIASECKSYKYVDFNIVTVPSSSSEAKTTHADASFHIHNYDQLRSKRTCTYIRSAHSNISPLFGLVLLFLNYTHLSVQGSFLSGGLTGSFS